MIQDKIIIIDLGSTENTELARLVRGFGVYSEIHPHDITKEELLALSQVKGIILNGGMNRVVDGENVTVSDDLYTLDIPVIAIDYPESKADTNFDEIPNESIIKEFVLKTCDSNPTWNMENYVKAEVKKLKETIGNKKVLLALSGGVDSSVVAALLIEAIGKQLYCVHVNNGLMRKNESEAVIDMFGESLGDNLIYIDATDRFLDKLANQDDPETKRKIIGHEFITIFDEESSKLDGIDFLAQGTIYSDVVESGTKTTKTVKSHHNVGGLPEDMEFELIEPLATLFKDEVREVGLVLGLNKEMVYRQPFPGPGLGIRVLGAITRDRIEATRESDAILHEEFVKAGLDQTVWQYFTAVPDFKSVGVQDGNRTYAYPVIIRAVNAVDGMSASIEPIPYDVLNKITERILSEVPYVNRVFYDLSPKPVASIEYE
ncbi:MAG TPA: glutamine-hydrolyzing GMP synthase [Erysipelothrix sp.]|nr:glutamine-hydrolyzing GMP synthase [Erysipelothrix sp.]